MDSSSKECKWDMDRCEFYIFFIIDGQCLHVFSGITVYLLKLRFTIVYCRSNCLVATYSTFCRNFGDYSTDTVGSHNWNEEAIEQMARDLGIPWETMKSTFSRDLEGREIRIQQLMDWVIEYLGQLI